MKLKLKLSYIEMQSICSLLCATCETLQAQMEEGSMEMEDKLYKALFDEMYVKLLKKQLEIQKTYLVEIKPSWAIAFHIQFSGLLDRRKHEGNLAQGICDRIHQHFS